MTNKNNSVIYQTPQGQDATGYFINGKTYKDPQGQQRVDLGSVVPTAGGTFMRTAAGSVKTPQSITDNIRNDYRAAGQNLTDAYNAKKQGIGIGLDRMEHQTNQQKKNVANQYANANRAAYQAYVNSANPYGAAAEQNARLGLANSGYSETSKMRLANTYQQSIGENTRARDQYINELDNALIEAKYKGDIDLANALSEHKMRVYQHGIDAAEAIAAQENHAYNAAMDLERDRWNRAIDERRLANDDRAFYADEAFRNKQFDADEAFRNKQFDADEAYRYNQLRRSGAGKSGASKEKDEEQKLWDRAMKLLQEGYWADWVLNTLNIKEGDYRGNRKW